MSHLKNSLIISPVLIRNVNAESVLAIRPAAIAKPSALLCLHFCFLNFCLDILALLFSRFVLITIKFDKNHDSTIHYT